jgi:hypothetical protein
MVTELKRRVEVAEENSRDSSTRPKKKTALATEPEARSVERKERELKKRRMTVK